MVLNVWQGLDCRMVCLILQVDRLHSEKACLQKEKSELQRTVTELGSSIDKMHRDKVALESQMEMEEEGIVNRLNRCDHFLAWTY